MRRLICSVIAVALLLIGRTSLGNTIEATLTNVVFNGTNFDYTYALTLTSGNGLANSSVSPASFESALVMLDFKGFAGGPVLSTSGGDITTTGSWNAFTTASGAGVVNNSSTAAGTTFLKGSSGLQVLGTDLSTEQNIVLQYTGSTLAPNLSTDPARSLVHVTLQSTIGFVSLTLASLSRDSGPSTSQRPVESYLTFGPDQFGGPFAPLPSAAGLGLILLGGLGFGRVRRMNLV
jgi:hypothetical protein